MAKLSEIFKAQIKSDSYNYEAKYNQSDGTESVDFKEGANYTLDNLTLKIAIDFAKYSLSLGSNYYYCKNSDTWYTWENDKPIEEEKVFQEFLKDYNG